MGYGVSSSCNRISQVTVYDFKYEVVKALGGVCVYCGDFAEVMDHVPPISKARFFSGHFIKVPACKQCNSFLSSISLVTLKERRKHVLSRMAVRRKKVLSTPEWTEEELSEIKYGSNRYIRKHLQMKKHLMERIKYINDNIDETFCDCVPGFQGIFSDID